MTRRLLTPAEWDLWHSWMEAQRIVVAQIDGSLQNVAGISKAEFSLLRTLGNAPEAVLRVGALGAALRWEKSRVSHLLSRMENRGLVERIEAGAPGRRTAVTLSPHGLDVLTTALRVHERSVGDLFIDRLTGEQSTAIRTWSQQTLNRSPLAEPGSTSSER
ncbi:MarR family winged helix-turn-helix transcriptional regulator [Subtercola endophyticus]|uniref:MarR family winged helix-turn-helix transcriptional regulator n=1 Tax=Subtercola endophyticus TaxID=2895559 RepID=UPI001E442B2F|nr:helix-turn-helix domain-containing protein [Subtercola endophyticus]UFS58192.1 MarR family transcriptional regulator [Subtercola endophyticus]